MNIRGLQTRLDKIESSAPRAVAILFRWDGHTTIAERREAIRDKAEEMNIPESAVDLMIVRCRPVTE